MLNIEVIKFEAQDVITASAVAAPQQKPADPVVPPVEPVEKCACADNCVKQGNYHFVINADGGRTACTGVNFNYKHDCGN